jgi:lipoyl(octanoyl) transferase
MGFVRVGNIIHAEIVLFKQMPSRSSQSRRRIVAVETAPAKGTRVMVSWITSPGLVDYEAACKEMEARADAIASGKAEEAIWLLEHPPLYTAGTSAEPDDLLEPDRFPVYQTRRGGQYTYHGPGQRVVYVMLNVGKRGKDVRRFVTQLESWVIDTLDQFNIVGHVRKGRVGVWIERHDKPLTGDDNVQEDKIAAIGIKMRKWVSFHGMSINVEPDLNHFSGIVPCGIDQHGVTSLVDLGLPVDIGDVDVALKKTFPNHFNSLVDS